MLNRSSLPVIEPGRFPPLFYLSVGGLLGLLVVTFVLGGRAAQKQAELLTDYGTALAQISAQDVMEASIGGDLVSMHAVMQRVATQPRVLRAAVHDLDQELLVQAGQGNVREQAHQAFTAAIPLYDSVEGHVTVTLYAGFPGESAVKWTLTGTSILLLILAALAVYEARGVAWHFRTESARQGNQFSGDDESLVEELVDEADRYFRSQDELLDTAGENISDGDIDADVDNTDPDNTDSDNAEQHGLSARQDESEEQPQSPPESTVLHCDLILALPNRARLEQQLNGERFLQLAWQFEKALDDVLALYSGVRVGASADASIVCVRFSSAESLAEAAFRAACSAYLIHGLTQASKVHFQLVAEVCHPDTDVKLAVSDAGIYIHASLAEAFLSSRLETAVAGEHRLRFEHFKGAYAPMLQRQLDQLRDA